jgi:hypothetical protein
MPNHGSERIGQKKRTKSQAIILVVSIFRFEWAISPNFEIKYFFDLTSSHEGFPSKVKFNEIPNAIQPRPFPIRNWVS